MSAPWKSPIYVAQLLTSLAAIGAIFADGQLTHLRLYLAAIAGLAMVASFVVAAHAEAESRRTRRNLETLLRSMEPLSFIIERLSMIIRATANSRGWRWDKQENLEQETVYSFHEARSAASGRLVMSEDEFKQVWVLEEDERVQYLERRLFGGAQRDVKKADTEDVKYFNQVVGQAVSDEAEGCLLLIAMHSQPDGAHVFTFRANQGDAEREFLNLAPSRQKELDAMIPLRRYATVADDARRGFRAIKMMATSTSWR